MIAEIFAGNKLVCTRHTSDMTKMNFQILRKRGDYHSLFAPKGYDLYNDETIVYQENQVSIKYLVEISS